MSALDHTAAGDAPIAPCRTAPVWQPRCIKLPAWPDMDQRLWQTGCTAGSPFEPGGHGSRLRPDSLQKVTKGYGAWLSFLQAHGWLEDSQPPADRVTRPRLVGYFQAMQARGQAGYSILERFGELRMAMKILAPERDTAWILRPNGVTIRAMLRPQPRAVIVPDAKVLFKWGIRLMQSAKVNAPRRAGLIQYRDGLLIAILASRARRLRSMSLLRLSHEFTRIADFYRVELQPEQVKTAKYDTFTLPTSLIPCVDQYLETVRPALLRGKRHDDFWVGINGKPLQRKGIQAMIGRLSKVRFDVTFGPHRFRHAIATTAPLRAPEHPGLAAPLLGISKEVVETHYNRSQQVSAVRTFQSIVEKLGRPDSSD